MTGPEHDAQGVDDIIVSVEAPTTDGFAYPSDAILAQAVLDHSVSENLTTRHAEAVYLHVWSTSGIFKFTPERAGFETLAGTPPIA